MKFRQATREERQIALLWFAAAASALVLRPIWQIAAPLLRPCTFRSLTGVPCPTCGTTRTALAILDLDVVSAFTVNPLAATVGLVFFVGGVFALVWALARGRVPVIEGRFRRGWLLALVAPILINWAYLILTDR
jgi:hypothetical protein